MNHEHNPNLVIMDLARLLLLVNEVNRRSFFKKHIGTIRSDSLGFSDKE